ncbi:MAG: hypothetical protein R3B06_04115 [Kofleriaceae bacterium]
MSRLLGPALLAGLVVVVAGACGCGRSPAAMVRTDARPIADAADAPPAFCPPAATGLVDVVGTPAGPYLVHHPSAAAPRDVPTIVFVPGGPGTRATATVTFDRWLSRGAALGDYRVVMPYADDGDLTDERARIVAVLDEALACFGGDREDVHLGGTSNGGRAAFALMLEHGDRFATLLGAPGLFPDVEDRALAAALAGKAVWNGVGGEDATWRPAVQAIHDRLTRLGIASVYRELPGQGHILDERADQELFFAFWAAHHR